MTSAPSVLVVGAGLGGLTAAAGLRRAGFEVRVLERDADLAARGQGYRINVNAGGDAALQACLPPAHHALYRATAHRQLDPSVDVFTPHLRLLDHRDAAAPAADPPPSAVDRATLRAILLDAAGGAERDGGPVRFGARVVGVHDDHERLLVHTAAGDDLAADLVVAADGVGSVLRRTRLPGHVPAPLGTTGIYGRAPLSTDELPWLPRGVVDQRFVGLRDDGGTTLALGAWHPREDPARAAAARVPGLRLAAPAPYVMWVLLGPTDELPPPGADPDALWTFARDRVSGWAPTATRFLRDAIRADTFRVELRAVEAVPDWPVGRVTYLGDAVHPMSPAGGEGANTALADAASLVAHLRHGVSPSALRAYRRDVRDRAHAALTRSQAYGQAPARTAGHHA